MKKALIVGINYYVNGNQLFGCVNDAQNVEEMLARHENGKVNFSCKILTAIDPNSQITRGELKDYIEELFKDNSEIALLYFAGHGHIEVTGGYILASDASRGDEGVSLAEVMTMANKSPAKNKVIILDSCHSGIAGSSPTRVNESTLTEGLTVLTASTADQYASEQNGSGLFTTLLVDALNGSASNLAGEITPGSVYAHIDQSLGPWDQRPVFKTNVTKFISLREVEPPISTSELQKLTEFFPIPGFEFQLDPTFEPELKGRDPGMPPPDPQNTAKFAILQKYNRLNLLVPVGVPHMWNAAMENKTCKLTTLGKHYRRLVEKQIL